MLVIIVSAISTWIIGLKMRRRIKRDLGRKATETDLTSLDIWMQVDDKEHRNERNSPLARMSHQENLESSSRITERGVYVVAPASRR
jgi:hypothetical protein